MPIDRTRTKVSAVVSGVGTGTVAQYGERSGSIAVLEVPGDVRAEITTPTANLYADLTLTFTVYALGQGAAPTASVEIQWSTDGGTTWTAITLAPGSSALSGLTTSAAGTSHTCIWDTIKDLGSDFDDTVQLQIRANDGVDDYFWRASDVFTVNNAPGQPTLYTPPSDAEKDTTPVRYGAIPTNPGARVVGDQVMRIEWDTAKSEDGDEPTGTSVEYRARSSSVHDGFEYSDTGRTTEDWATAAAASYSAWPKNFLVGSRGTDDNKDLRVEEDSGARASTVTIPDQADVDGATLAAALKAALDADGTLAGTYTVSYNSTTGKFTFSVAGGATTFSFKTALSTIDGTIGLEGDSAEGASWESDCDVHGGLPWWAHGSYFKFTVQAADALTNQETNYYWWARAGE